MNTKDMKSDEELIERYLFRRPADFFVCNLSDFWAFSPRVQFLMFLRFVATGAFRQLVGVSKVTARRCIKSQMPVLFFLNHHVSNTCRHDFYPCLESLG